MVTEKDVSHTANLAKVDLEEEDIQKFRKDFEDILGYFNILDEVEEDIEPSSHVLSLVNIFREDKEGECLSQEEALKNAKHVEDGYIKGPRVIE